MRHIILIGPSHLFADLMSRFTRTEHVGITELTIGDTTYINTGFTAQLPKNLDPATTSYRHIDPDFEPQLYGGAGSTAAQLYRRDTSHIHFVDRGTSKSGKTRIWTVHAWADGAILGDIRWYAPWRRYTFSSLVDAVFDKACLEDVCIFLAWKMSEHKGGRQ